MQATITYLLSEQAQRAAMAATGQPVTRKQTITAEIRPEDIDLFSVDDQGNASLDLSGYGSRITLDGLGRRYEADGIQTAESIIAAIRDADAKRAAKKAEHDAMLRANAEHNAQILAELRSQFFADQAARYPSHTSRPEDRRFAWPADPVPEFDSGWYEEIRRRNGVDAEAKRAAEAAKEQAKIDFIAAWIAEHGTESQRARHADGLLPRREILDAMAAAAFAPGANLPGVRKPEPDCDNEEDCQHCETATSDDDLDDGITDSEYASLQTIKAALPGGQYILREHESWHDCRHDDCHKGTTRGCLVKLPLGPFTFEREFGL